ncbi:MAG: hypothetical protein QM764_09605 [Chitinophagaceae bacterium]
MNQLINIRLSTSGEEFLICNYLTLSRSPQNDLINFKFYGVQRLKNIAIHNTIINLTITFCNNKNEWTFFNEFEIVVLRSEIDFSKHMEWSVIGTMRNVDEFEYIHRRMEVFNMWQKKVVFDWFSLPINSPLKLDYISACMIYSGLGMKMIDRDFYSFDVSLIKEERDFNYLSGVEFIGERGYFGHDLHTYKDCLLEIVLHNDYFYGRRVILKNFHRIYNSEIASYFADMRKVLLDYKFTVIIEEGNAINSAG